MKNRSNSKNSAGKNACETADKNVCATVAVYGCALALLWAAILILLPTTSQAASPVVTPLGSYQELLQAPARLAVDPSGNLYVTEPKAGQVLVFNPFGQLVSVTPGFAGPLGLAVDANGHIFVGEARKGSVSVFDSQWRLLYKLGRGDGEFSLPTYIAIDPANGAVFVADSAAHEIKVYLEGTLASRFGSQGTNTGQFDFPTGLFVSGAGEVFVIDHNNDRVQVFDRTGAFLRAFSLVTQLGGMAGAVGGRSQGMAGDAQGRIYVADSFQDFIRVFDTQGNYLTRFGSLGNARGQFRTPLGLALDGYNRLFVASANAGRLEIYGLDNFLHFSSSASKVAPGTNVTFSIITGGPEPLTVQWRKGANLLSDGGNISGATSATLTLNDLSVSDSGNYSVMVNGTNLSPLAPLSVAPLPPTVDQDPASQMVQWNSPAEFSVSGQGSPLLAYQWRLENVDLIGQTNATLALPQVQDSDAGNYAVVLANSAGSITTAVAALTINHPPLANPVTITRAPADLAYLSVSDLMTNITDPDGDLASLTAISLNTQAGAIVSLLGDWITYTPFPGYSDSDNFTYTLSDGRGGTTTGLVNVAIASNNTLVTSFIAQISETGVISILFSGVPGRTYQVQYTTNLTTPIWQTLTNLTADCTGIFDYLEAAPTTSETRFYRSLER